MYVQLLGRDLAYFSLDPGCWSLVGFCSWSYVPGNFLYRTFCIRNRLRSEDIIPCHQFLYIYSSHFVFFSEAAKEHKSKHVNCSKIRMTSEVTPEKGSPRQLLSCAGNKAAKGSKMPHVEYWVVEFAPKVSPNYWLKDRERTREYSTVQKMPTPGNTVLDPPHSTYAACKQALQQFLQRSMIIKFNDWWLHF